MQLWHEHSWGDHRSAPENEPNELAITIQEVRQGTPVPEEGYIPLDIVTNRGILEARFFPSPGATRAAVWVGGVGGGFDSPASNLYDRLARRFQDEGVASLRLRYRFPTELDEAVLDVLVGVTVLTSLDLGNVAVIGHSFGGAVAIKAAVLSQEVATVVTLATQSFGTEFASHLGRRPLLLIHGAADRVLSSHASVSIADRVRGPKQLVVLPGTGHTLDETAAEVERLVHDWITANLREQAA